MQLIDIQKLITNTWKFMIKIKNNHIVSIGIKMFCMDGQWDVNSLTGWVISQKLHKKKNKKLKKYNEDSNEGYILDADVQKSVKLHENSKSWKTFTQLGW